MMIFGAEFQTKLCDAASARLLIDSGSMPQATIAYDCLVISPSDVAEERQAVAGVIETFNGGVGSRIGVVVRTRRWEHHVVPELGAHPQAIVNRQIVDDSDIGVAIFWSRLGTPTEEDVSGSIEEIRRLVERKARVMVYRCTRPIEQEALRADPTQFSRLSEKLAELSAKGIVQDFNSIEVLRTKITSHLIVAVMELEKQRVEVETRAGNRVATPDDMFSTERSYWAEERRLFATASSPCGTCQYKWDSGLLSSM